MTNNTKKRHQQILAVAHEAIKAAGGVEVIDEMDNDERKAKLRELKISVASETGCTIDTARRNVAKAMRQDRDGVEPDRRGGWRGGGRPPLDDDQKRQKVSTSLAFGLKEVAQAIAKIKGLRGWGHTLDVALVRIVHTDDDLREKLAEMGIVVKANDGKGL